MVDSVITNFGKGRIALFLAGSNLIEYPQYTIIGTGSEPVTVTDTELVTSYDRQKFTTTTITSVSGIQFQTDWNVVEVSGIQLTEWGVIGSATGLTGSIWSHHNIDAVTFDGINELRIIENWVVE